MSRDSNFLEINSMWLSNMNYIDTYNRIKRWIIEEVPSTMDKRQYNIIIESKLDILERIEENIDGKATKTIVNDFINGNVYSPMRNEMFSLYVQSY